MEIELLRKKWKELKESKQLITTQDNIIITSLQHIDYFNQIKDDISHKYNSIKFYYYCDIYKYRRLALTIHLNDHHKLKTSKWTQWLKNHTKSLNSDIIKAMLNK